MAKTKKTKKKNGEKRRFIDLIGGDVLRSRTVLDQIPLLVLILLMCLATVYNRYRVEALTREKVQLEARVVPARAACTNATPLPRVDTYLANRPGARHGRCGSRGGTALRNQRVITQNRRDQTCIATIDYKI